MPENDPARLDVWVTTRDHRYLNIEMQNKMHPFFLDRMQLYNAYLTLRGKYDFNRSDYFMNMTEKERKFHFYELPETFSIWLCNFPILGDKDVYKDIWAVYSEYEVNTGKALPLLTKNKYIVVDLPNFLRLREGVRSREDFWLRLISQGPLQVPATEDPLFLQALNRLRVSRVKPELLKHMEANMSDHHAFDAIMAEAWLKGEAQGMAQGEAKGEAKGEARTLSVFRDLGVSPEKIAEAKARLATLSSK